MRSDYHQESVPEVLIEEFWNNSSWQVVDARSPKEFTQGNIPGSVNLPLLDDLERHEVGILYKQFGQSTAIKKGYDFLGLKITKFGEEQGLLDKDKKLAVYCARGGLRSQILTTLLNDFGFDCYKVPEGYKGFRNWILKRLDSVALPNVYLLCGQTGVGKTLIIHQLENSLDLEGLAGHRGSLFGGIGLAPVNQKDFEATLLHRLESLDLTKPVYIEGESRKIGPVFIPQSLFNIMRKAKVVWLEASAPARALRIVDEYITGQPHCIEEIPKVIQKLQRDLGKKNVDYLLDCFGQKQYQECFQFILLNYYDKKYSHSMKDFQIDHKISSESIEEAVHKIIEVSNLK